MLFAQDPSTTLTCIPTEMSYGLSSSHLLSFLIRSYELRITHYGSRITIHVSQLTFRLPNNLGF
jgi:hypothetical protein